MCKTRARLVHLSPPRRSGLPRGCWRPLATNVLNKLLESMSPDELHELISEVYAQERSAAKSDKPKVNGSVFSDVPRIAGKGHLRTFRYYDTSR